LTREREKKIQPDLPNGTGAARFFSVQHTKLEKYTKPSENIPVGYKIHQKKSGSAGWHQCCQIFLRTTYETWKII
jgi:hypothetical protein